MLIGDVSKKFGVSIDTLRYYDKIGILVPDRNNEYRNYTEKSLKKLQVILELKKMQFTLDEIKYCLEIDEKIDQGIEENFINVDAIQLELKAVKKKYQDILELEEDLKKAKVKLEHIMNKIERFIEEEVPNEDK